MIILSNTTIHIESEEAIKFENYPYNINRKFGEKYNLYYLMIKLKFVSSTRLEISTSGCQNVNIVHANS